MIGAVLFDLDNTLLDRQASVRAFAPKLQHYFRELLGDVSLVDITQAVIEADNGGYVSPQWGFESLREQMGRVLIRHFPALGEVGDERVGDYWQQVFPASAVAMAAMTPTLAALAKNYQLAVLSNGPNASRQQCAQALGLTIPIYATSELIAHKPDARAFKQVLSAQGWQAGEVVYVGDHPINDYQGAQQAGLMPVWLRGHHDWPFSTPPTLAIDRLDQLPGVLSKL